MNSKLILIGLLLVLFSTQVYADTTPPVTTFTSFQVPNTTDQNITLTCTDDNSGCKTINYKIDGNSIWTTKTIGPDTSTTLLGVTGTSNSDQYGASQQAQAFTLESASKIAGVSIYVNTKTGTPPDLNIKIETNNAGVPSGTLAFPNAYKVVTASQLTAGQDNNIIFTSDYNLPAGTYHIVVINVAGGGDASNKYSLYYAGSGNGRSYWNGSVWLANNPNQARYGYLITESTIPLPTFSFLYSVVGDHNIQYFSTDKSDNNETTKTSTFTTYGVGKFTFYDDSLNLLNSINYTITPSINGVSSGTTSGNTLDLNLQGITTGEYTFAFSKSSYTTLTFTIPLTQYTDFDYNFIMLDVNKTTNVNFQVFNESGAYAKTKTFYAYDYSLNKYVGIQTTDTLGRLTFNLDQTKSDYNFFSADFNFGTTTWTINKPKDIVTLSDINGTWGYSITGPSYSNASNIAAGIQKLLLQNTVYPYLIKIVDTNKSYASTTFGLKSVTSEKEKTLTPYLYKYADADLKLIKLIDFATNQPHSSSEELTLSLYTDNNGLIPIGIFVNDSTGTYNIYMDENATYELQVLSQSYNLRPTLDIYYLYLTEDIGIIIDNNLIVDVNAPIMDANLPIIFTQLREAVFGCSSTTDNCYPSMIFSLIAVALLLIVLAISGQIGAISQSITIGILLTMFLIIGFIPLWLYGVGVVILIAWGVFGQ